MRPLRTTLGKLTTLFAIGTIGAASSAPSRCLAQEAAEVSRERIGDLVRQLGSGSDREREEAGAALRKIGTPALPMLGEAAKDTDPEQGQRAEKVVRTIRRDEARADIEAFLADVEGAKGVEAPGWVRFRASVGDRADTRRLFVEALRAEPELFVLLATEPDRLTEALRKRVADLEAFSKTQDSYEYDMGRLVGSNITFGTLASVLLLATDHAATTDVYTDGGLSAITRHGVHLASLGTYKVVGPDGREIDGQDTSHLKAVKRLLIAWIAREGDPRSVAVKHGLAFRSFGNDHLDDAHLPLALHYFRSWGRIPKGDNRWIDPTLQREVFPFAIGTVRALGDKRHISLLAPLLESSNLASWSPRQGGLGADKVEVRDAALGLIVRLSGEDPLKYGFERKNEIPRNEILYFPTAAERNRAFARCREDFRTLGLDKPPHYDPEPVAPPDRIVYEKGETAGDLRADPTDRVRIKVEGSTARLLNAGTGELIGGELNHEHPWAPKGELKVACWTFSPDGKLVATGAGYLLHQRSGDVNVGRICVWETATGALIETAPGRTGTIRGLAFKEDSKTLLFQCELYKVDGP